MYKFKRYGNSYISTNDILLITGKDFQVFDLTSGETLFLDKEVFGKRKTDVSHICVNEKVGIVVLISFDSDYAIYEIDFSKKTINKKMFYKQRHRLYCCDAANVWMDNKYAYAIIDQPNGEIVRRISFDGSFKDLVLEESHYIIDFFKIENSLVVKNKENKYFIFDRDGFETGDIFKPFITNKPTFNVIGDAILNPNTTLVYNQGVIEFYKDIDSKPFYTFPFNKVINDKFYSSTRIRIIDNDVLIAVVQREKIGEKKYSLPITKQTITITQGNETKIIDLGIEDINSPTFNKRWVAYYSCEHHEVRVQPIK